MIFNEYTDILEYGETYFLDEENLFQLLFEDGENDKSPIGNTLNSNDSTATSSEGGNQQQNNNQQQNQGNNENAKKQGRTLFEFFKNQAANISKIAADQMGKIKGRMGDLGNKLKSVPNDYNGEEEIEMPTDNFDPPPKFQRPGGEDLNGWRGAFANFKSKVDAWYQNGKRRNRKAVKGAASIAGGWWLIKQIQKMSGEVEINFKEGKFYTSMGMGQANKAAGGNGFASSLALLIKNVLLAIFVLIGGIFKIMKEYFSALGRIVGTALSTIGKAGKTLVTGQMS